MRSIVFIVLAAVSLLTFSPVFAAEPSAEKNWELYGKTGWFSWQESRKGAPFIRDDGMMYAIGITRTDRIYKRLSLSETVEMWGGHPEYDGQPMFSKKDVHSTNGYLGTREEIRASVAIPVSSSVSIDPFFGIGHKVWFRMREGEIWNTVYSPLGMRIAYRFDKGTSAFAEGGVTLPWFTAEHGFMARQGKGYQDIDLSPKAKIGQFAEIGVNIRSFSISLAYEATEFDKSDIVTTKSLDGYSTMRFYQPESSTSTTWLKVGYSF